MNSTGRIALLLVAATGAARAEVNASALEFARLPLSVRQAAGSGYASYDVLRAFDNPAMLGNQPRSWEVGFTNQVLFEGDESLWGAGAAWAGKGNESGAWAAGIVASGLGTGTMEELDLYGDKTGAKVTSSGMRVGGAVAYQWPSVQVGLGVGQASETLEGVPGAAVKAPTSMLIDVGIAAIVKSITGGAAFHARSGGAASAVTAGAAVKLTSPVEGAVGAEANVPFGGASKPYATAGAVWNAHKLVDVRAGALIPTGGGGTAARIGVTVKLAGGALDYAFSMPFGTGLGASHLIGVGYRFGAEREIGPRKTTVFAVSMQERTMAVANFDPQGVSATDAAVVADLLRSALIQDGAFNIVEKANMDKVLGEQAFQQTGCTTQECAVKLGKILNVKYLIVGTFAKSLGQYLVAVRVVDVQTAKAVYADEAEGTTFADLRAAIKKLASRMSGAVQKAK